MTKKNLVLSILVGVGIVFMAGCLKRPVSNQTLPKENPNSPEQAVKETKNNEQNNLDSLAEGMGRDVEKTMLEALVFAAVEEKTGGKWERRMGIEAMHESKKAAKGSWWTKDKWSWVAWQNADKEWKVLVGSDNFGCEELNEVPGEYWDFFKDMPGLSKENCL